MHRVVVASLFVCGLLVLAAPARADGVSSPHDGRLRYEVHARFRAGLVNGQLQTPDGGSPTSTSFARPTLDELNVDDAAAFGGRVGVLWRQHRIFADYQRLDLVGSATLSEALLSQNDLYPAGTRVRSTTYIERITLGYRYAFHIPLRGRGGCLEIAPGLGYSTFGFNYRLRGDNGESASRSYRDFVPHLDIGVRWRPSRRSRIWFEAEARQSLVFLLSGGRVTDLFDTSARLHYDMNRNVSAFFGVGYQHMFKRDGQPMPNRPHVDFGPFFEVGFSFRF